MVSFSILNDISVAVDDENISLVDVYFPRDVDSVVVLIGCFLTKLLAIE